MIPAAVLLLDSELKERRHAQARFYHRNRAARGHQDAEPPERPSQPERNEQNPFIRIMSKTSTRELPFPDSLSIPIAQALFMLDLSVLDQSPVRSGGTPAQALAETIQLAQAADSLGYRRYWLAEHHGTDGFAGSAPEVLITRVAAATSSIRVGAGGVMLAHYSPLKVAENFRVLENLYPGRIDLGIGRAPGSDPITARALAYGSQIGIEYFPSRIADLIAFLEDSSPATEAFEKVRATPKAPSVPEIWLLGSSAQSAIYAARFGLAFSFAHFISPVGGDEVLRAYRERFQPSGMLEKPRESLCVFVICADTEEEAKRLAISRDLWRLRLERGEPGPYPSVEEAQSYPYTDAEKARVEANRTRNVVGDPEQVKERIERTAEEYGAGEIVVLTITHDFAARLRSYELLAGAFGLQPPAPQGIAE